MPNNTSHLRIKVPLTRSKRNFLAKRAANQKEYKGSLKVNSVYTNNPENDANKKGDNHKGGKRGKRRGNSSTRRRRTKRKGTRRA